MRHLTNGVAALAVVSLALLAGACNKGPARGRARGGRPGARRRDARDREVRAGASSRALEAAVRRPARSSSKGNYTAALKAAQAAARADPGRARRRRVQKKGRLVDGMERAARRLPGEVAGGHRQAERHRRRRGRSRGG